MLELRIEDLAGFQNFVRYEPAMFQEMVDRLTPLICKLETNYHKALDPDLKVAIILRYRGQFQMFTVWFPCGIQHYLFAHS